MNEEKVSVLSVVSLILIVFGFIGVLSFCEIEERNITIVMKRWEQNSDFSNDCSAWFTDSSGIKYNIIGTKKGEPNAYERIFLIETNETYTIRTLGFDWLYRISIEEKRGFKRSFLP